MGVFDYIECEYPISAPADVEFQTKDTDAQYMERYKITADGKLMHETGEYKVVPKNERTYPNAADDSLMHFAGSIRMDNKRWVEVPMRGEIRFYGTDNNKKWWEYSALFKDGHLIDMKVIAEGTDD